MIAAHNIDNRIQARAMTELRASPAVCDEYLREMNARRRPWWQLVLGALATLVGGPMVCLAIPGLLAYGVVITVGPDLTLALAGTASTCASLLFAIFYILVLQRSPDVSVLSHLPVADADLARKVWRRIALVIAPYMCIPVAAHSAVAFELGLGVAGWGLALGLALVQGVTIIAVGTILAVYRPHGRYAQWLTAVAIATFAFWGAALLQPNAIPRAAVADVLYVITPGGWVAGVLGRGFLQNELQSWFGLPVAVGIVFYAIWTLRRLPGFYRVSAFDVRQGQSVKAICFKQEQPIAAGIDDGEEPATPESDPIAELNALLDADSARLTEAEAEALIREGDFLRPRPDKDMGWIERFVYRRLTPRQRNVIDFFSAEETGWTATFHSVMCTVTVLAGIGLMFNFTVLLPWVTLCSLATAFSDIQWRFAGIRQSQIGGTSASISACVPIDFVESFRAFHRVVFIRMLFAMPVAIAASIVYQIHFGWPPLTMVSSAVGLFVILAVGPTWVAVSLLSNGAQLPAFRWRQAHLYAARILALVLVISGCSLLAAVVAIGPQIGAVMVAPEVLWSGVVISLVTSAVIVRYYYPWMDRHGHIDWTSGPIALLPERAIRNQERFVMYQSRGKLLREKHGRFWWLKRRLRQWCAGEN